MKPGDLVRSHQDPTVGIILDIRIDSQPRLTVVKVYFPSQKRILWFSGLQLRVVNEAG